MIRSKHNSLINYFIHDNRDLAPGYIRSCEKFLDGLRKKGYKLQAPSLKPQAPSATKRTQLNSTK